MGDEGVDPLIPRHDVTCVHFEGGASAAAGKVRRCEGCSLPLAPPKEGGTRIFRHCCRQCALCPVGDEGVDLLIPRHDITCVHFEGADVGRASAGGEDAGGAGPAVRGAGAP